MARSTEWCVVAQAILCFTCVLIAISATTSPMRPVSSSSRTAQRDYMSARVDIKGSRGIAEMLCGGPFKCAPSFSLANSLGLRGQSSFGIQAGYKLESPAAETRGYFKHAPNLGLRGGGISGFQAWFKSEFAEAIMEVSDGYQDCFDHVAFDMNGILHTACRRANTVEHAVLRVYRELDATLKIIVPRQSIILAFDGPGPYAKLLTQRKRRAKSAQQSKYKLSGLSITPGTRFMREVREACQYYACLRLQTSHRFRNVTVFVSGSDVSGEGEVKILEWW